jgi:hypothetical protein
VLISVTKLDSSESSGVGVPTGLLLEPPGMVAIAPEGDSHPNINPDESGVKKSKLKKKFFMRKILLEKSGSEKIRKIIR